jgi:DAACS family dicarboxylate/amino acid:cation (Na+ or H+) symporter
VDGLSAIAEQVAQPVGQLYVRVLVAVVIPLAVTSLVLALADLEPSALGRLGARALAFAAGSSAIAALIGLLLVTAVGPGRGARELLPEPAPRPAAREPRAPSPSPPQLAIPIGALVVAALGTGLALSRLEPGRSRALRAAVERLHALSTRAARWVMRLAPVGVGALLFAMVVRLGAEALRPLAAYVAVVIGGLLLHGGGVYSLAVWLLGGMSPAAFFRGAAPAMATAFATSSSAATLPTALRVAEERLRLPPAVARLVLTAGSAMNQNGTSLFEGVTVLFLAQVQGVELSLLQQAGVMAIAVLAGIGSAGVPGGGMAAITIVLGLFGIPLEGVALVAGVDRLLDMCRTTVNVTGDLALAVVVAKGEPAE